MAVGLDTDGEYLRRSSIPSGGAGTLTGGGFADFFVGVWVYRDSADATYANTADGAIIHGQAGAREIKLGYDNTFGSGTASDPLLQVIFNSGGGTGATQTFSGANFLNEWVYYFFYENSADSQVAGYIRLSDLSTAVTITRANDNAGSQYINTLTIGSDSSQAAVAAGNYAYARAVNDAGLVAADAITYAGSDVTETGDWGFWPCDTNTDTADDSGNSRTLTFSSGLTTETSPTLGGGGIAVGQVTETDTAQPIAARLLRSVGQVSETSTAQPITARLALAAGQVLETDTALAMSARLLAGVGQAAETDSAQPITQGGSAMLVGQVTETDSAQPIGAYVRAAVGLTTETDTAQTVTARVSRALGQPSEIDTAQQIVISGSVPVGQAAETDAAQPVGVGQRLTLQQVLETDTAQQIRPALSRVLGIPAETDTAFAITRRLRGALGIAVEIDEALPIGMPGPENPNPSPLANGPRIARRRTGEVMELLFDADGVPYGARRKNGAVLRFTALLGPGRGSAVTSAGDIVKII